MGVVAVAPEIPQAGVPDLVLIEKARKSMAGCGGCLEGMGNVDPSTGEYVEYGGVPQVGIPAAPVPFNWEPFMTTLARGTMSIASSVLTPPTYQTITSPSGSMTTIRTGGGLNYPPQGPLQGSLGLGISTDTLLLLGLGLATLFMLSRGR